MAKIKKHVRAESAVSFIKTDQVVEWVSGRTVVAAVAAVVVVAVAAVQAVAEWQPRASFAGSASSSPATRVRPDRCHSSIRRIRN